MAKAGSAVNPPPGAADQRFLEKVGKPLGGALPALCALQLRSPAPGAPHDARDGRWRHQQALGGLGYGCTVGSVQAEAGKSRANKRRFGPIRCSKTPNPTCYHVLMGYITIALKCAKCGTNFEADLEAGRAGTGHAGFSVRCPKCGQRNNHLPTPAIATRESK